MTRGYIRTIQDMEERYYPKVDLMKADDPVLSTTTAVWQATYGAFAWAQLNLEANALGIIPKYPWNRTGWRVVTARRSTGTVGGVAENAALPDSAKPTWATQETKPKTVAHTFNLSEIQQYLAAEAVDDDGLVDMEYLRQFEAVEHKEQMNRMLLGDVETLAGDNLESIDRVCSNNSESALLSAATDSDLYGDTLRSTAASWKDAYVNHNSDVDRDLTDSVYRTAINAVYANGGNTTAIVTGHTTYSKLQGLYDTRVYYNVLGNSTASIGVNGIQTKDGFGFGINVATLYGVPLIVSKDVVTDTIDRIYILDTSDPEAFGVPRLGLKMAKLTQYFEAGMSSGDPFGIDKIADEGLYRTSAELICTFFAAQGKIRDLK